jgi:4-hydroxy-4-methyl-2-oxoglutarate aldolase
MYSVVKHYEKTPAELVEAYAQLEESASINESMPGKAGALHSGIRTIWPETRMCGVALTVQCGVGDNIMLHKAISMAGPGDVLLVVNGGYDEAGGMFGGMMAASLKARGAAGLVIEGACRDTVLIKKLEFPVFSTNISIKATTKLSPGRINCPIVIGGVPVKPGDLVYGDNDGVVVVPREQAAEVLAVAQAREKREEEQLQRILGGEMTTFDFFRDNYAALTLHEEA